MRSIKAPTLSHAHEQAIKTVLEKGWVIRTEDREDTVEAEEVAVRVEDPKKEPMISPSSRFQRKFMEKYAQDLLHGSTSVFEYDYHDRLFNWGKNLEQEGTPVHVNQVQYIIDKLKESPVSRRAIAITWNPATDETMADCPCLQLVQCIIREGKLHMKVVFRSNDMLTAAGANMFALATLQDYIARQLGISCGSYTHISLVPHIYYRRDITDIEPFCGRGSKIRPIQEVCRACGKCP